MPVVIFKNFCLRCSGRLGDSYRVVVGKMMFVFWSEGRVH